MLNFFRAFVYASASPLTLFVLGGAKLPPLSVILI